jgi:hypothetical protein
MSSSNAIFGTRGDFTTSPEISQIFGEVCALCEGSSESRRSRTLSAENVACRNLADFPVDEGRTHTQHQTSRARTRAGNVDG